jgi:NAD(P)H-dependent flavin oxidoreductase YrpB (nitropropane dioxygenase family)
VSEFILMLTRDDKTVSDARRILDEIGDCGLRFVGFKDIGVPEDELQALVEDIRRRGQHPVLEVVSLSEEDESASIEAARRLGVDYLIGGTRPKQMIARVRGSDIKYFPYIGEVVGHPAQLEGSPEELVADALRVQELGVDGINLLAYRHAGDGLGVAKAVREAVEVPLICAGSIASLERVREISAVGIWAFTIGGAVMDRTIVPGAGLREQVEAVLATAATAPS